MNQKMKLTIFLLLFAALIGGAAFAYGRLSAGREDARLALLGAGSGKTAESASAGAATAESTGSPQTKETAAQTKAAETTVPESKVAESNEAGAKTADSKTEESKNAETKAEETTAGGAGDGSDATEMAAPDFTVYDTDGTARRFSDYVALGKPIVLNFWASWCPPCRGEMPHFDEAYQTYSDRVTFLFVDMTDGQRETKEDATAFIEKEGYSFPILLDSDSDAASVYGIASIPTTVFIDADGMILGGIEGAMDADTLEQAMQTLLGN